MHCKVEIIIIIIIIIITMIHDMIFLTVLGYTLHNGPVEVSVRVGSDVPKGLVPLMKSYAHMLVEFRKIELCEENFLDLTRFLSVFCDEESIQQCNTTDQVICSLQRNLKIYIFNIEPLEASCDHFHSSAVKTMLDQYRDQLKHFLSNCSVKEFKGVLKTEIRASSKVETVTVKLEESIAEYTLGALRKLIFHFFGVLYKVLLHCGIDDGCVRVTWVVTASLIPILREKAEQLSPEYLASKGVLELVIGLRIVPNEGLSKLINSRGAFGFQTPFYEAGLVHRYTNFCNSSLSFQSIVNRLKYVLMHELCKVQHH